MDKRVVELFAGVGGFRIGLNNVSLNPQDKTIEKGDFDFVWTNQWEPSTKIQHAFDCYVKRFGKSDSHVNDDISKINKKEIPDHTLLVGGFPCQDYSVARSLSKEKGIQGKKGVLWWEIRDILEAKNPPFVLLENVDRLLKSPSKQRGRDFGIMLRSMSDLGYGVEWRVINAAEYGHPQKRRRVFIFGFHKSTSYYKNLKSLKIISILQADGLFAKQFPIKEILLPINEINISKTKFEDLVQMSDSFKFQFSNTGIMFNNHIYTTQTLPILSKPKTLSQIILKDKISEDFFIGKKVEKYQYLKGSKSIPRTNKATGIQYNYSEGKMTFPDDLSLPGRTMLTSEGSVNRSTHVIEDHLTGKLRLITPIEAERLNEFPDNWTDTGMTKSKRYFMMGNALVTGVVKKIGKELSSIIENE